MAKGAQALSLACRLCAPKTDCHESVGAKAHVCDTQTHAWYCKPIKLKVRVSRSIALHVFMVSRFKLAGFTPALPTGGVAPLAGLVSTPVRHGAARKAMWHPPKPFDSWAELLVKHALALESRRLQRGCAIISNFGAWCFAGHGKSVQSCAGQTKLPKRRTQQAPLAIMWCF